MGKDPYNYQSFDAVLEMIDSILQEECHMAPAPWRLNEENKWPFGIRIDDKNGNCVLSSDRSAYSTSHKSLADVRMCAGFGEDRADCIAANRAQMANHMVAAYSTEAIKAMIAYLWFATNLVPTSLLASDGMDLPFQHLITIVEVSTGKLWVWWKQKLSEVDRG
jgi:hypothetical protein